MIISLWGKPEVIDTDNRTEFANKVMGEAIRFYKFAYTTIVNSTTRVTPAFLTFGRQQRPNVSLNRKKLSLSLIRRNGSNTWRGSVNYKNQ